MATFTVTSVGEIFDEMLMMLSFLINFYAS